MQEDKNTAGEHEKPVTARPVTSTPQGSEDDILFKLELFYKKYKLIILGALGAIVLGIGGYFGYQYLIVKPRIEKSEIAVFKPLLYFFEKDSFNLAIDGTTGTMNDVKGLAAIANEYGSTDAGNIAYYAAGISYLNIGAYDQALTALDESDFDGDEVMLGTMRLGAMGDAYLDKGDTEKALEMYQEAIERNPNEFTTPMYLKKAAMVLESKGSYSQALDMYNRIKNDFAESAQARDIDKYISRAEHNVKLGS
jgi:tetratricopeptide (TPR) repeat protein